VWLDVELKRINERVDSRVGKAMEMLSLMSDTSEVRLGDLEAGSQQAFGGLEVRLEAEREERWTALAELRSDLDEQRDRLADLCEQSQAGQSLLANDVGAILGRFVTGLHNGVPPVAVEGADAGADHAGKSRLDESAARMQHEQLACEIEALHGRLEEKSKSIAELQTQQQGTAEAMHIQSQVMSVNMGAVKTHIIDNFKEFQSHCKKQISDMMVVHSKQERAVESLHEQVEAILASIKELGVQSAEVEQIKSLRDDKKRGSQSADEKDQERGFQRACPTAVGSFSNSPIRELDVGRSEVTT
jgi:uncharacterized membrane protein